MYDPILVALDGSRRAEHVLPHVADLAAAFGGRVILLQVLEPPTTGGGSSIERDRYTGVERTRISMYLARQLARLQKQGATAVAEVAEGTPYEVIVQRATDMAAGLIAMSTRGRGGLGRFIFGSVATAVVRSASCPVFVIRPTISLRGQVASPRQILGVVGGGDTVAAGAPGHAAVFTSRYGAALTLLRTTVSVAALRAGSGPGVHPRELVARERLEAAIEVAELGRDLRKRGLNVSDETLSGDVARVALRRARELGADLVVVGAAGPGSVAEEIARRAPCPVLIADAHPVPGKLTDSLNARIGRGSAD